MNLRIKEPAVIGKSSLVLLYALLLSLISGCSGTSAEEDGPAPVWPEPPAPARIRYEKSIRRPMDLGMKRSWWKTALGYVIGQNFRDPVFMKPMGIALDEEGNLCVTDTGTRAVWFFNLKQGRFDRWERIGEESFTSPVAIAKKDGLFYVADSGLGAVVVFDENGKHRFTLREGLSRPAGIAVMDDRLWVVDAARHRVEVYDLEGRHLFGFGGRGGATGALNYPTHLAIGGGEETSIYVTDSMNFRVQQFNAEGQFLRSIGSLGDVSGCFSRPKGLACDSEGNLYVVDALFDNVQIFDPVGRFLMHWGEGGAAPGQFWLPSGIAIDKQNRIWVADSYNRRIQVFSLINGQQDRGYRDEL